MTESRMLIDGKLEDAASSYDNVNPATEEVIGQVSDGSADDVRRAVEAARRAFDETTWSSDHKLRARCIEQLAAAMEEAKEELRVATVQESGSPILLSYSVQLEFPIQWLSYWSDVAVNYEYEQTLSDIDFMGQIHKGVKLREPIGVVGMITPFNFPVYLNLTKIGPALASGCTMVLKPAPDTPWAATIMGRLIAEKTDIPPGVINVVPSRGVEAGEAMTTDARVDMVSFTGSTATGSKIMEACAGTVKKCFLELGGKSANILLDDGDFAMGVGLGTAYVCTHSGQGCALYTRMLLPRSRYDEGVELARAAFETFAYGDPMNPAHLQGPQINERQRAKVLSMIETGVQEGGKVIVGGGKPAGLEKGFYVEPTVLVDVDPGATLAQEEIFGPVLVIIPYENDDDAVRIANDSKYGLSGSVWSASTDRAMDVARRIRTGTVGINGGQWLHVSRPFGGYRQSGVGRENGIEGFEEYLETKVVAFPG
ncbi:MAG: aldehyde dehydrogenase family protein [Actinomycetota bacterium]